MECWSISPVDFSEMATTAKIYDIGEVVLLHKCAGLDFAIYGISIYVVIYGTYIYSDVSFSSLVM